MLDLLREKFLVRLLLLIETSLETSLVLLKEKFLVKLLVLETSFTLLKDKFLVRLLLLFGDDIRGAINALQTNL